MERQMSPTLDGIRKDHVERYRFAASILPAFSRVLDAASGCGYGSSILLAAGCHVDGIDASQQAIDYANEHYGGPRYLHGKIETAKFMRKWYDAVVSFETLEHLKDPLHALLKFKDVTDKIICSVPNEEQYPFNPKNFEGEEFPHLRHYTPEEFEGLLNAAGFIVESKHSQKDKQSPVTDGTNGMFLIYVGSR